MITPQLNRYILCRFEPLHSGKFNKIPVNPKTLENINAFDKTHHISYEDAKSRLFELNHKSPGVYGLAFVFLKEDKYFFIDIDDCLTNQNTWNDLAVDVIKKFPGCYVEVSHSQRGLHIIGKYIGERPVHTCKNAELGLEIYTDQRFVALTEYQARGNCEYVATTEMKQFLGFYKFINPNLVIKPEWTTESNPQCCVPEDNQELLQIILDKNLTAPEAFGQVVTFVDLWCNNSEVLSRWFKTTIPGKAYDYSSADLALATRLLYFTGGNCERTKELMYLSALKRDKWDIHGSYLSATILKAAENKKEFYMFSHHNQRQYINPPIVRNQQNLNLSLCEIQNFSELSFRGKVLDTKNNLKFVLETFSISVRYNKMTREREIKFPNFSVFSEDEQNQALFLVKDIATRNNMPLGRIDEHLDTIALENSYHPIVEGILANPWDGKPRLQEFINTLTTDNPLLTTKILTRWMLQAMAAAFSENGFSNSGVLVLSGPQFIGKTRFIKSLDPFNCGAVKGGVLIDPSNKDNIRILAKHWLVELGELDASFNKQDIARIKSFITEDSDLVRLPYARKETLMPRRTAYAATVNDDNFLVDHTGNRRWWTTRTTKINLNHDIDMVQVWAEIYFMFKNGEQTYMTQEEFLLINENNKQHEQINPFEELVHVFFDFSDEWDKEELAKYTSSEVLRIMGYMQPSKGQATIMGQLLTKLTGKNPIRSMNNRYHLLKRRK